MMYRDIDETLRAQIADLKVKVAARQEEASRLEKRLREAEQANNGTFFLVDGERRYSFQHRWRAVEARKQREARMSPLDLLRKTWFGAAVVAVLTLGLMFLSMLLGMLL